MRCRGGSDGGEAGGLDDDTALARLLSGVAAEHAPDERHIMGRVTGRVAAERSTRATPGRRRPALAALGVGMVAATATAVGIALAASPGATVVPRAGASPGAGGDRGPSAASGVLGEGISTTAPGPVPVPPGAPASGPSPTAATTGSAEVSGSGSPSGQSPATTGAAGLAGTGTGSAASRPPLVLDVSPAPATLVLDEASYRDWVVVGSRSDGRAVVLKDGAGLQDVPAATAGVPVVAAAPVSVLWDGGLPEQDRTVNTTWWTVASPAGWTVTAVPQGARRLVVLAGGNATDASIEVAVDGVGVSRAVIPGGASRAWLVSVPTEGLGDTAVLRVAIAPAGVSDGTTLGLAAVVLE